MTLSTRYILVNLVGEASDDDNDEFWIDEPLEKESDSSSEDKDETLA